MDITDGRGENKRQEALKNKKIVADFFIINPGSTIKKCCEQTGFDYKTVKRHIDAIKKEEE